jgi:8-oxo-dGTP pyrophosphatase MutT (NUDIX family)
MALKRFGSVMGNVIASRAVKGKGNNSGPIAVGVELIQDLSAISSPVEGFLRRHRHRVKTLLSDGTRTDTYVVDYVDRAASTRDAVGFIPFAKKHIPGETLILLRKQVRYAAWIATGTPLICEVAAGVIEQPETPEETSQRELYEETGIEVDLSRVRPLGRPIFVLPGSLTERLFVTSIEVTEEMINAAIEAGISGDGDPFEEGAELVAIRLDEAMRAIAGTKSGATPDIVDAKSEVIIRRLRDALLEGTL